MNLFDWKDTFNIICIIVININDQLGHLELCLEEQFTIILIKRNSDEEEKRWNYNGHLLVSPFAMIHNTRRCVVTCTLLLVVLVHLHKCHR